MRNLITGGAGFVGCNLAAELLRRGEEVVVFDNLSRGGTEHNLAWLKSLNAPGFTFVRGDVRSEKNISEHLAGIDAVFHLAAQVAVTTSIENPREDFEINALGTLNVLEACRNRRPSPRIVYTSTNKVYGGLEHLEVADAGDRYHIPAMPDGLPEAETLDFHSPYGCSKGAADQYVRDYSRIFGIPTVVFRMSCIYGPHQFGNEDQGWVMHFVASCLKEKPITIYGDGKQVRDILFVDDLLHALIRGRDVAPRYPGNILNIGGGPRNAIPINTILKVAKERGTPPVGVSYGPWRWGDQKVYISSIDKVRKELGWEPRVDWHEGVERIFQWAGENLEQFP